MSDADVQELLKMSGEELLAYLDGQDAPSDVPKPPGHPPKSPFQTAQRGRYIPDTAASPCAGCGGAIKEFWGGAVLLPAARVVELTIARHGRPLCADCSCHEAALRVAQAVR